MTDQSDAGTNHPVLLAEEWEWEIFTEAGLRSFSDAKYAEAQHFWDRALRLAENWTASDPRRAASINNSGLSALAASSFATARQHFESALQQWELGLPWVSAMQIAIRATSSTFHLRMRQRHESAFINLHLRRCASLVQGNRALSCFNLAMAFYALDCDEAADVMLGNACAMREAHCGDSGGALAYMRAVLAGRYDSQGKTQEAERMGQQARDGIKTERPGWELWRAERPAEMNDSRRLLAAIHLTGIATERVLFGR